MTYMKLIQIERPPMDREIAALATRIAWLEMEATQSVGRPDPDSAHLERQDYDGFCEDIIQLKRRLNELKIESAVNGQENRHLSA